MIIENLAHQSQIFNDITMDITSLATKQKRALDWKNFLDNSNVSPKLKELIISNLSVYSKLLSDCWKSGQVSTSTEAHLISLETDLEDLNEQVRLATPQTQSRDLEK